MKNNILKIIIVFVLCFGIKAQAQVTITEYGQKISKLSDLDFQAIDYLANGAPTSMFVTFDNETKIHMGDSKEVVEMSIDKTSDFSNLSKAYPNQLIDIVLININWDGQEQILIDEDLVSRLRNLKYIYIRSYKELDKNIIQSEFHELLEKFKDKEDIDVLYSTMEQPS